MIVWNAYKSKVRCLCFSPDGKQLASVAEKVSGVRLWEPTTGQNLGELRGRWGFTWGVCFSPDGKLIATVTADYRVVIWDRETQKALSAPEETDIRYGPAFAPDSSSVAASGYGSVAIWNDPATAHPDTLGPYNGSNWQPDTQLKFDAGDYVTDKFDSIAFSPDGQWVVAHGLFRAVVWNRKTRKVARVISHTLETDFLTSVAFSPDSTRLVIGYEKCAEIHPVKKKAKAVELKGHTQFVRAVGFTPDGQTAMTASSDGLVRFWDAATGTQTRVFDWNIGRLYSACFSPDGLTCAAGGENGQIVVWDVDT
ncbi:MAG: WD40 repeat domain-containing protein [Planctomycetia bacterium]|nr:WD40 repeat domain-containing protein [Planctomycetia bacterium]